MNHARISPSGYNRWSTCAGSYTLQKKLGTLIPPEQSGDAAILGTELHDNAEQALKGLCEAREATAFYVSYCKATATLEKDSELFIEHPVSLFYSRDEHGYADCVVRTEKEVHVIDLKTGQVPVEAVNNLQLFIYAYGMGTTSTERFKMTIIQDDTAKSWEIDMYQADVLASIIEVKAKAALNDYIHELVPSESACKYCPCRPYCPAYTEKLLESFDDLTNKLERLSDAKMAYLFKHSKQIKSTLAEIEKVLYSRVIDGEKIDGVDLKTGRRGNKTWSKKVDPVSAMITAGIPADKTTVSKPITVTQAMKLADIDDDAWTQQSGKPTLIAGEAYNPANDFDLLE